MKTQISRDSFQPDKRYGGVYQQQGRMLTDADWNEQVAVARGQLVQALVDAIGDGAPRTGALAIAADPVTADLKIRPGDLYVDGIRAVLPGTGLLGANEQPDLDGYPALPKAGAYTVYADVWERAVTALEDSRLRDEGLHGADTCTRTQTMLQVKKCDHQASLAALPRCGDALMSLSLQASLEAKDPCDPCAGLISAGKGRVGSYLFRLEVHEVEGDAKSPTSVTLKWSSENGAEQYESGAADTLPPGFVSGDFIYEFYDTKSEKQIGLFLGADFAPIHGELTTSGEFPPQPPAGMVRRWDGWCKLAKSAAGWVLTGWDQGANLAGALPLAGPLQLDLKALRLKLELDGKIFLAGDFWLADVREAVKKPGDAIISPGIPPQGITHHYLILAQVDSGKVAAFEGAELRRRAFPPLTDLWASDVGYETTCGRVLARPPREILFDRSHDTVAKALNRLCQLQAEHVGYTGSCESGLFKDFRGTVKDALDKVCQITAGNVAFSKPCETGLYANKDKVIATVADALGLLCDIPAGEVSYTPSETCNYLGQLSTDTVQKALDALCARPGGCRITVGERGVFPNLDLALGALLGSKEGKDICLCLLPGEHRFRGGEIATPSPDAHICLSGCGASTRLFLAGDRMAFTGFASVSITCMDITACKENTGALAFDGCQEVRVSGVSVSGLLPEKIAGLPTAGFPSLVFIGDAQKANLESSALEAAHPGSLQLARKIFDLNGDLGALFGLADRREFEEMVIPTAERLALMDGPGRAKLADGIKERKSLEALSHREDQSYFFLEEALRLETVQAEDFTGPLRRIRREAIRARPGVALVIDDARADCLVADCDIAGVVRLYGEKPAGPFSQLVDALSGFVKEGRVTFEGTSAEFRMSGCQVSRMEVSDWVSENMRALAGQGKGIMARLYETGLLTGCLFALGDNQLAFANANLSSNAFDQRDTRSADAARVIGESAIYVGNRSGQGARIVDAVPQDGLAQAANVGLQIT
jgi:hypothetical protein